MRNSINKFLSVPVFGILYLITGVGVIIVVILSWFGAKKPVRFLSKEWARTVFLLMGKKIQVEGLENIEKDRKYIILANHASLFDIVAITSFYPNVSWFGHERLLKVPVFGRFLKLTDYIPFREPTIRNTRHMLNQLFERSNNQSVALFPEGTRTLNGQINPFYRGFIYLFRSRDIGILPLTLNGFYELKPKNRFFIDFRSKLEVIIHKSIPREELIDKTDREILNTIRNVIESAHSHYKPLN
jgi:1-acyl-sn-glycerol-3-phosphate acyltransferase